MRCIQSLCYHYYTLVKYKTHILCDKNFYDTLTEPTTRAFTIHFFRNTYPLFYPTLSELLQVAQNNDCGNRRRASTNGAKHHKREPQNDSAAAASGLSPKGHRLSVEPASFAIHIPSSSASVASSFNRFGFGV